MICPLGVELRPRFSWKGLSSGDELHCSRAVEISGRRLRVQMEAGVQSAGLLPVQGSRFGRVKCVCPAWPVQALLPHLTDTVQLELSMCFRCSCSQCSRPWKILGLKSIFCKKLIQIPGLRSPQAAGFSTHGRPCKLDVDFILASATAS